MIDFDAVTVTYPDASIPALRDVSLHIPEGELCLVVGRTGVGKSTLLGAINGLVPHFTGGVLAGRVTVAGLDTRTHPPRELAGVVGVVMQDPVNGFVTDTVEEELAYGMEQLAVPAAVMRKRVEETLDLLGIADLRRRSVRSLSGGQQQRVAIGSVLTAHPRVLVLDEPTSALDPAAAEDVLAALTRLVHDLGVTVVLAEHRLERVIEYADMVVVVDATGSVTSGTPVEMMDVSDVAPPVVRLGQAVGWDPLPLSVRDARRRSDDLRVRLDGRDAQAAPPQYEPVVALRARKLVVRYGEVVAVANVDLDLHAGQVVALMGRNGSGKTSLLWALQGSGPRHGGTVRLADGSDPAGLSPAQARTRVGLVPQSPGDLLYLSTVAGECDLADGESDLPSGACRAILDRIVPGISDRAHPRDLSEGQRLALALSVQLCATPGIIMLDEPTRGLDEAAKVRFGGIVKDLAAQGRAVVVATHDVEFVANVADRVVVLAEGEIVADGATADVVVASPIFAPQVAKVMRPARWLTVAQVAAALATEQAR
ncbi:MAG: ATP-binding cassette domain-containing protein [Ilumatobacteraceae bacterium]